MRTQAPITRRKIINLRINGRLARLLTVIISAMPTYEPWCALYQVDKFTLCYIRTYGRRKVKLWRNSSSFYTTAQVA